MVSKELYIGLGRVSQNIKNSVVIWLRKNTKKLLCNYNALYQTVHGVLVKFQFNLDSDVKVCTVQYITTEKEDSKRRVTRLSDILHVFLWRW